MDLLAAYDRFEVAAWSTIALLVAVTFYWTNRRQSDDEPIPSRGEKLMLWVSIGMLAAILATATAVR